MNSYRPSLDYFLIIASHLNITKAAKELHVSQQNLSIYVKKLEQYYNVQLFIRRPNLKLTPAGNVLLNYALKIQQTYYELDQQLQQFSSVKTQLTVGCCRAKLPNLIGYFRIPEYQKKYPDVEIKIIEETSSTLEKMLEKHQLDFYIGNNGYIPPVFESFLLQTYPYCVVISRTLLEQYNGKDSDQVIRHWKNGVILKELNQLPYISASNGYLTKCIERYERSSHVQFHIAAEHNNPDARIQMCRHNLGFTISEIPVDELEREGLLAFPIAEPAISLPLACICRAGEQMPSHIEALWRLILDKNAPGHFPAQT